MVLFLFSLFIFYLSIFLYLKYANPPKAIIAITKAITITVLPACGNAVGLCELLVFCTPFPVFPLFTLLTLPLIVSSITSSTPPTNSPSTYPFISASSAISNTNSF